MSAIGENVTKLAKGPKGQSASSSSSNGASGKDVTSKIGAPSKKGIDKSSREYQELFKGLNATQRSTVKSLANQGYDIDQLKKYLGHSMHDRVYIMHRIY